MRKTSAMQQMQSLAIELATERLRSIIEAAHAGRPIEIDGITYVPEVKR